MDDPDVCEYRDTFMGIDLRKKGILISIGFFVIFFAPARLFSDVKKLDKKIQTHQKDLDTLNKKIVNLEAEKRKLKDEESQLSKKLLKIEVEIERSNKRQVEINREILQTETKIKNLGKDVRAFSEEAKMWEEQILSAMRHYYMHYLPTENLYGRSTSRVLEARLISFQSDAYAQTLTKRDTTLEHQTELLNYNKRLAGLKQKLYLENQQQIKAKDQKKLLLETVLGRKIAAEQEMDRLRQTSKSLTNLLSQLIKKKEKSLAEAKADAQIKKSLQVKKGRFAWPVRGDVVSKFGKSMHPDLNILVINNGIHFRTAMKEPVQAIENGKVIYASDFRSYGQTVIVDHGGEFYTIYGLLGEILVREGKKINQGEMIGRSSNSGDSQIYFEVRVHGEVENPMDWLEERRIKQ